MDFSYDNLLSFFLVKGPTKPAYLALERTVLRFNQSNAVASVVTALLLLLNWLTNHSQCFLCENHQGT